MTILSIALVSAAGAARVRSAIAMANRPGQARRTWLRPAAAGRSCRDVNRLCVEAWEFPSRTAARRLERVGLGTASPVEWGANRSSVRQRLLARADRVFPGHRTLGRHHLMDALRRFGPRSLTRLAKRGLNPSLSNTDQGHWHCDLPRAKTLQESTAPRSQVPDSWTVRTNPAWSQTGNRRHRCMK